MLDLLYSEFKTTHITEYFTKYILKLAMFINESNKFIYTYIMFVLSLINPAFPKVNGHCLYM